MGCEYVNFVHKKSKNFVEHKLDLMVQVYIVCSCIQVYPLRKNTRVTVKKHIYSMVLTERSVYRQTLPKVVNILTKAILFSLVNFFPKIICLFKVISFVQVQRAHALK